MEQFIFNKILADTTLLALLSDGAGGIHLYPSVVPRDIEATNAATFTRIGSTYVYPDAQSTTFQFNIFTKTHAQGVAIARALDDVFSENNLQQDAGVKVVYSQRRSESDLGYNFDDVYYQREVTYYFKLR